MPDTTTTNYNLTKPAVGEVAGQDLWGAKLNNNFDLIDAALKGLDDKMGAELIASGTVSTSVAYFELTLPAGYNSYKLLVHDLMPAATGTAYLTSRFKVGGVWFSSVGSYAWMVTYGSSAGPGTWYQGASGALSSVIFMNASTPVLGTAISLEATYFPSDSSGSPSMLFNTYEHMGPANVICNGGGYVGTYGRLEAIRIGWSAVNLNKAKYKLYGFK